MKLEKARVLIREFPWLEQYFTQVTWNSRAKPLSTTESARIWIATMLSERTRHIAVKPLGNINFFTNPACSYMLPIPQPFAGVEKPVDAMAFCLTSDKSFEIREQGAKVWAHRQRIPIKDKLTYSVATYFCYEGIDDRRLKRVPPEKVNYGFEYLPSTHTIDQALLQFCEGRGERCIRPYALIVSSLLWSHAFQEIMRTFDIYRMTPHERNPTLNPDLCSRYKAMTE